MIEIIRRISIDNYSPPASAEEFWHEAMRRKPIEFEYLLQEHLGRDSNEIEESELDDFIRYEEAYIRQQLQMYKENDEGERPGYCDDITAAP